MNDEIEWERLERLAKRAFEAGELNTAQDLLEKASKMAGVESTVMANLGLVRFSRGDYAGAISAYSQLEEMDVDNRVNRGLAFERTGNVEMAREDYRAALEIAPDDVDALVNLGTLEIDAGFPDLARELLERAYAIDPTAGWQLSDALRMGGNLDSAVEVLNSAIAAGERRAYVDLGSVERERGNSRASRAAYETAVALGVIEASEVPHDER